MGFFSFNKKKDYKDFKAVLVDDLYFIKLPENWHQYESDRFRARAMDGSIDFSITNYGKPIIGTDDFGIEDLKRQFLPLLDKFVKEGGYISNNDLEIGIDYIYQSFKVDGETQYYLYTYRTIQKDLRIIISFIIRQQGLFEKRHAILIKDIGSSITRKVS